MKIIHDHIPPMKYPQVLLVKSSDSTCQYTIVKGRNHILLSASKKLVLFTIIYKESNELLIRTYSYFPIALKSSEPSKTSVCHYQPFNECSYNNNSLIALHYDDISRIQIQPLIKDSFSYHFYFKVSQALNSNEEYHPYQSSSISCIDNLCEMTQESESQTKNIIDDSKRDSLIGIKTKRSDLQSQCTICFENVTYLSTLDKCNHKFCNGCITSWAKYSSQCPICKVQYTKIITYDSSSSRNRTKKVKRKQFVYDEDDGDENEEDDWIDNVAENCMICNKGDNNYVMLVCDRCEYNICHTYCAGLRYIPEGAWYCKECVMQSKNNRSMRSNSYKKNKIIELPAYSSSSMKMRLRSKGKISSTIKDY